jgi:membrane associated rhomboid family serine protease
MFPIHDDNPTEIFPYLTVSFIAICSVIFLWQVSLDPAMHQAVLYTLGMVPAVLFGYVSLPPEITVIPPVATLVTSMFLHGGWMHLIGNMWYLWIFGNNVEDAMGHIRFVVFYLVCGIAAALAQALPAPDSQVPMIGASGAISGVLGAYLLLHPRAHVLVVIPLGFYLHTTRLPAMLVLGFWFVLQLLNSLLTGQDGGGVAWGAHIGGFVAGVLLIPLFKHRRVRLLR